MSGDTVERLRRWRFNLQTLALQNASNSCILFRYSDVYTCKLLFFLTMIVWSLHGVKLLQKANWNRFKLWILDITNFLFYFKKKKQKKKKKKHQNAVSLVMVHCDCCQFLFFVVWCTYSNCTPGGATGPPHFLRESAIFIHAAHGYPPVRDWM